MYSGASGRGSAILRAKFSEIPEGVVILGNVAEGEELRSALGSVPPSNLMVDRHSFTLIYRFPRSSSRSLEGALRYLAALLAESGGDNGLEVNMEEGEGGELVVLRMRRVLHPSEVDVEILDLIRRYARRLEEAIARAIEESLA